MKNNRFSLYLAALLCLPACDDPIAPILPPCVNECVDATTLYQCNDRGGIDVKTCPHGCENGACLDKQPPPICTRNACKDAKTLLVCDANSGKYTEKICPNGCKDDACLDESPQKCTKDACKDAKTLLVCDANSGKYTEKICPNGCKDDACTSDDSGDPCVKDTCKDAKTLLVCDKSTMTTREESCPYYCYEDACVPPPIPCAYGDAPRCDGDDKLVFCDNLDGEHDYEYTAHCAPGRTCKTIQGVGACVVDDSIGDSACVSNACKDLNTLVVCNDGKPTEQPCGDDAYCIDDKCRPRYTPCDSDADCKSLGMTCVDGRCASAQSSCASDSDCKASGEYCVDNVCTQRNEIAVCHDDADCKSDEICRHGICYLKSNMELKIGDPCDWDKFQEYCDDSGKAEIKCGYEKTVEKNDCSSLGGCAVYVKTAYMTNKPVRNAICRGEEERLRECQKPGVTSYQCVNVLDPYFSYFMSVAEACAVATDGTMIHLYQRDQYSCDSMCDENTGLCPNAPPECPSGDCPCTKNTCKNDSTLNVCNGDGSITEKICPTGCVDGQCADPTPILGKSCPTESNAFCHDNSVVYCAETSLTSTTGKWSSYNCPEGFVCFDQEGESICAETCTTIGSESSVCGTTSIGSIMLKTVCAQVGDKRVYLRDFDSMTQCDNGCTDDNKTCK